MSASVIKLCPKLILEGTRLTGKTDLVLALNENPRIVGIRKYRYHAPNDQSKTKLVTSRIGWKQPEASTQPNRPQIQKTRFGQPKGYGSQLELAKIAQVSPLGYRSDRCMKRRKYEMR